MTADEARTRIAQLSMELERHNRLYHVEASPVISDREYDALHRELEELEAPAEAEAALHLYLLPSRKKYWLKNLQEPGAAIVLMAHFFSKM